MSQLKEYLLEKRAEMDKDAYVQLILPVALGGLSVYGAGKSGVDAYKHFRKGETKEGWKDVGWSSLNVATAGMGGAWTIRAAEKAAKLARIAARYEKAGNPQRASQIMARAQRLRAGATEAARASREAAALAAVKQAAPGTTAHVQGLIAHAHTLPIAQRAAAFQNIEKVIQQTPKEAIAGLTPADIKSLQGLVQQGFLTKYFGWMKKPFQTQGYQKVRDITRDINALPLTSAARVAPGTVSTIGRTKEGANIARTIIPTNVSKTYMAEQAKKGVQMGPAGPRGAFGKSMTFMERPSIVMPSIGAAFAAPYVLGHPGEHPEAGVAQESTDTTFGLTPQQRMRLQQARMGYTMMQTGGVPVPRLPEF